MCNAVNNIRNAFEEAMYKMNSDFIEMISKHDEKVQAIVNSFKDGYEVCPKEFESNEALGSLPKHCNIRSNLTQRFFFPNGHQNKVTLFNSSLSKNPPLSCVTFSNQIGLDLLF